jgi:hypothetical protein
MVVPFVMGVRDRFLLVTDGARAGVEDHRQAAVVVAGPRQTAVRFAAVGEAQPGAADQRGQRLLLGGIGACGHRRARPGFGVPEDEGQFQAVAGAQR